MATAPLDGRRKQTPLHVAISGNKTECAELLLKNKANPDVMDKYGRTPRDWAVAKGEAKCVKLFEQKK